MRLWQLRIERFRGIRKLDWNISERLICLVGPGDSTKSTLLDAVNLVASPRSGLTFDDNDFYRGRTSRGFWIQAIFGELPASLTRENRFGLELGGRDAEGRFYDEPEDHAPTLTIRLDVDESLDASWRVVSASNLEGRPIGPRDRALLSVARIGHSPERQFSWTRGSALAKGTADPDDVNEILAAAYREIRAAVGVTDVSALSEALRAASLAGTQVGAGSVVDDLSVRLEVSPTSGAALSLHSGDIPMRASGLGTRRLFAIGLELGATPTGAVVCLDEIETGLEPHRLRQLLSAMSRIVGADAGGNGQVFFTSHSPVVLQELGTSGVEVVRNDSGAVTVTPLDADLIDIVRANPSALLANKVVVCEGRTEVGLILGMEDEWSSRHGARPLSHIGVAVADGAGASAPARAQKFAQLGFEVLLLADSDRKMDPTRASLESRGVSVVQWDGEVCTEQRLGLDLSLTSLQLLLGLTADTTGHEPEHLVDAMFGSPAGKAALERCGLTRRDTGDTIEALIDAGLDDAEVRQMFGSAAQTKGWFKTIPTAMDVARVVATDALLTTSNVGTVLRQVESWCYGHD